MQHDVNVIVLAPNVADVNEQAQASGVMVMPRVAVLRVTPLPTLPAHALGQRGCGGGLLGLSGIRVTQYPGSDTGDPCRGCFVTLLLHGTIPCVVRRNWTAREMSPTPAE